ncbi:MAG: SsrA-binding protein SmpB [Gammaproteobacteria bacterium]|nr:SsrA-binding protein SmpB [Gammaproteobacteria bacterium]MYD77192.1 SsrA-binding protein SmpB [Gammaproteobacteria bacterium]MYJ51790.1 SsrA-binding protein SmpB [Gammaproteobacteria bacterium]
MKKTNNLDSSLIAVNKKARFNYAIEEEFEAGIALKGWEVKSLRANRVQLSESYVTVYKGEVFLVGAHISPLLSTSTHVDPDPVRPRKLLLHAREISKLIGSTERAGYTVVPLRLYWARGRAKLRIALAKGKKLHDKRQTVKQREWDRQKQRLLKQT